jgi:hypothetical protein
MIKLIKYLETQDKHRQHLDNWDREMFNPTDITADLMMTKPIQDETLREYVIHFRMGRSFTCRPNDFDDVKRNALKMMQIDLYEEFRPMLHRLREAVYEQNSEACNALITLMEREMFDV